MAAWWHRKGKENGIGDEPDENVWAPEPEPSRAIHPATVVWSEPTAEELEAHSAISAEDAPRHSLSSPPPPDSAASPASPHQTDLPGADVSNAKGNTGMSQLDQAIGELLAIEGATGAAIVDIGSGMALAHGGNPGFSLEVAAASNSNVVRAKVNTMRELGISDDIDDILITLGQSYHLIKVLQDEDNKGLFLYLTLNRANANLALARHKLGVVARKVRI